MTYTGISTAYDLYHRARHTWCVENPITGELAVMAFGPPFDPGSLDQAIRAYQPALDGVNAWLEDIEENDW